MASRELDDAVTAIVARMLKGEWEPGSSHLDFSERYGVTVQTVRTWAADASRFIRLCSGSEDEIRDALLRDIHRIGGKAEQVGDFRNALGSKELVAKVHGLLERKPTAEPMTPDEMHARIVALGYRKDTDATEPGTEAAERRGGADSPREEREEKGRATGFHSSDDE